MFGEKIVVLGANFRQTANVVLCGFVMDVIESNIQSSVLFSQVEILHLTENMRAHNQSAFTKWLTDIGNRSEERRVGKECRSRWEEENVKKKRENRDDDSSSKTREE